MSEKNKAISLVSIILLIFSLVLLYQGISYSNKSLKQSIEVAETNMNSMILSIQDFSFTPYTSRIGSLLQTNPQIIKAFAQREREVLYQLVLPKYRALQKENEYFHVMHFHLPDATTLLRMHKPEFYGDNLKNVRPIVDAVHETKKLLVGYEIGRHGSFYRFVYPVFFQKTYVGALEFGIKIHEVLASLERRNIKNVTAFFSRDNWKKFDLSSTKQVRDLEPYVLLTHGNSLFNKIHHSLTIGKNDQRMTIDQRQYIFHSHPIFNNYQGKTIGGLAVLQDITDLINAKNAFIIKAVAFTSILLLISFLTLYLTFGKMIAKLVAAEKSASTAKEEWERTFDAVPDMISILDDQHQIIKANKAMAENKGIAVQDLIHTKCYKSIHTASEPPLYCPHAKLLKDHKAHTVEVFDEQMQRHLTITVSPLNDSNGKFFGSVHVVRDISTQKKAEAKLQKAEKMEAVGLLAGGVAHDLNNILSGVVSYPELLLLQLSPDDKLYEPIKAIQKSGKRAAAVVADLLTVARGIATVKEVTSLNTLIKDYFDSTECRKLQSLHSEVNVQFKLSEDLWHIECSPVHIQKVLMNLITNAIEAIDVTGTVLVSTANQELNSSTRAPISLDSGEYVVLTVKDTGTGISAHDLPRIFEPFYTKKAMGRSGTGLGLAVVWNTMKDHGAFIHVDSDENGTTFTLYFQPCHKDASKQKPDVNIQRLKGSGTILVVDDEEQQRDIASKMLTILGYTVDTVSDGEQAIVYCRETPVDLVILDMLMEPGINGLQTYQKIIDFCPEQKAIIASGFSESRNVLDTKTLGAGSFISKPYSIEQLGTAVQKELAQ